MEDNGDSTLTPKESDKNNKEKPEENLENDGADHHQHKMNETDHENIVIEAEPLAWKPPAADIHQNQLFMPCYRDGQFYGLPAGWQVERRPRTSPKYIGKVDQYYYEPVTHRQFRSLKAARKYLLEIRGQQHEQLPLPQPRQENDEPAPRNKDEHTPEVKQQADKSEASQSSGGHSKNKVKRKRKQASSSFQFDFANPPEKVTWALTDAESDQWKPFVGEKIVPEAVKDLWAETFQSVIYQKNKAPKL